MQNKETERKRNTKGRMEFNKLLTHLKEGGRHNNYQSKEVLTKVEKS